MTEERIPREEVVQKVVESIINQLENSEEMNLQEPGVSDALDRNSIGFLCDSISKKDSFYSSHEEKQTSYVPKDYVNKMQSINSTVKYLDALMKMISLPVTKASHEEAKLSKSMFDGSILSPVPVEYSIDPNTPKMEADIPQNDLVNALDSSDFSLITAADEETKIGITYKVQTTTTQMEFQTDDKSVYIAELEQRIQEFEQRDAETKQVITEFASTIEDLKTQVVRKENQLVAIKEENLSLARALGEHQNQTKFAPKSDTELESLNEELQHQRDFAASEVEKLHTAMQKLAKYDPSTRKIKYLQVMKDENSRLQKEIKELNADRLHKITNRSANNLVPPSPRLSAPTKHSPRKLDESDMDRNKLFRKIWNENKSLKAQIEDLTKKLAHSSASSQRKSGIKKAFDLKTISPRRTALNERSVNV